MAATISDKPFAKPRDGGVWGVWGVWWPSDRDDPAGCEPKVRTAADVTTVHPTAVQLPSG